MVEKVYFDSIADRLDEEQWKKTKHGRDKAKEALQERQYIVVLFVIITTVL